MHNLCHTYAIPMPKYTKGKVKGKVKEKVKEKGTSIIRVYWMNVQTDIRKFLKIK